MIRAGKLRPIGWLREQQRDDGGNLSQEFTDVPGCARVRGEKLSESAGQRKAAAGIFGHDTMTYRMRYRRDIDRSKIIVTDDGHQLDIIGVENVQDRNREMVVTVRDRKPN